MLLTFANTDASFPELEERVARQAIKPEQIDGSEDKEITMKFASGERKFSGQSLLLNFCLPNFYFHATTAYDILRQSGVELGKRDFMGTPPQLKRQRCALTRFRPPAASRGWFGNDSWELIWAHDGKCSACQSASRFGLILPSITKTPGAPSATHALTGSRSASVRTVAPRAP